MTKQIGFIGLGLMGGNMVRCLLAAGYSVTAYEKDPQTAACYKDEVTLVADVKAVAKSCKIICTSLPDPKAVNAVYLGAEGILETAKAGTVTLDFSTTDPQTAKHIHEVGVQRNIGVIDCPVSGGPQNCLEGSLVLIIGGDDADVAKADAVLQTLGATLHRAGSSGAGQTVKLITNAIALSNMMITTEVFVLGVKAGVNPDTLYSILRTSGARSYHLEKRIPFVLAGDFSPRFKLETARKDVGLAMNLSRQVEMPVSILATIFEMFNVGMAKGYGGEDCVAIIKYFEELAGVEARSDK